jgi:hypothetical protein
MDCTSAQAVLAFDRPWASELDAAEADALRAHLAACPTCAAHAERERLTEERLAQAMRDVPVPKGLPGRLLDRLAADRRLVFRRRFWQATAAAAAVLVALGIGWYIRLSLRPTVDANEIVREFDDRPYSQEGVQEWFRKRHGVTMVAPGQFNNSALNYDYLRWYDLAQFQGRQVPALCFAAPGDTSACAMIFVLSDDAFNFADTTVPPAPAPGSFHRVDIVRPADNPHFLFVILYTSASLRPFLKDLPGGV